MSGENQNTVEIHERVAKLEERVDGGFKFIGKELKEIKTTTYINSKMMLVS